MPSVDEDWIVRLRAKLGIVPKSMEKIPPIIKTKPPIPDLPLADDKGRAKPVVAKLPQVDSGNEIASSITRSIRGGD